MEAIKEGQGDSHCHPNYVNQTGQESIRKFKNNDIRKEELGVSFSDIECSLTNVVTGFLFCFV